MVGFLLCRLSFRDLVGFSKSALLQFLLALALPRTAVAEHNANKMQFSTAKIRFLTQYLPLDEKASSVLFCWIGVVFIKVEK